MRIEGSMKNIGRPYYSKREFKSELPVSRMTGLGESLLELESQNELDNFNPDFSNDKATKFHDVDESFKLLMMYPCNESIC